MSFKGKILVLKRVRSGDQDLIAKVYCQGGVLSLLVRDGYSVSSPFFGVFEPFNLVEADVEQRGDVLVPNDVISVERISFLARDYRHYTWMCWISLFVLTRIKLYDERVFRLITRFLLLNPGRRASAYRILFRMNLIESLGWRPKFLDQKVGRGPVRVKLSDGSVAEDGDLELPPSVLMAIRKMAEIGVDRVSIRGDLAGRIESFLDTYMDYHMR